MFPASSVSGHYFNHPEAKYFAVGKLAKDQVDDYSIHKGQPLTETEKWLAHYLDYSSFAEKNQRPALCLSILNLC